VLVIHVLLDVIGFDRFTIRVINRRVLSGVLERVDLADKAADILRALDKLAKIGPDKVSEEMKTSAGASDSQVRAVLELAALEGTNTDVLAALEPLVAGSETGAQGLAELHTLHQGFCAAAPEARLRLDVSIARGLDYYTGTVFETFLDDLPAIGSVCSGGRYDDLASVYTKERLPGIGASLGLDRLLAAMEELGLLGTRPCAAPVLLTFFAADRADDYLALAARLRAAGIGVELYPDAKKLGAQLKYADRRGFPIALVIGENEWEAGTCQVKDLRSGQATEVPQDELVGEIERVLER